VRDNRYCKRIRERREEVESLVACCTYAYVFCSSSRLISPVLLTTNPSAIRLGIFPESSADSLRFPKSRRHPPPTWPVHRRSTAKGVVLILPDQVSSSSITESLSSSKSHRPVNRSQPRNHASQPVQIQVSHKTSLPAYSPRKHLTRSTRILPFSQHLAQHPSTSSPIHSHDELIRRKSVVIRPWSELECVIDKARWIQWSIARNHNFLHCSWR